jgi:hypothetical protein
VSCICPNTAQVLPPDVMLLAEPSLEELLAAVEAALCIYSDCSANRQCCLCATDAAQVVLWLGVLQLAKPGHVL